MTTFELALVDLFVTKNIQRINHLQPAATRMVECIRERIHSAVAVNPTHTPSDIAVGKGVPSVDFLPSAVDTASCHLGKISRGYEKKLQRISIVTCNL